METRYAYVARALTEAIGDGRHPIGSVLPNEFELAEQFAVSRSTVRAAMRELQASGLVSRKRNAGTKVEAQLPQRSAGGFAQALGSIEAVQQFGVQTERHVQRAADVVTDDALARAPGCQPGRRWLCISGLRLIPNDETRTPICWTDVYIDGAFANEERARMDGHPDIFGAGREDFRAAIQRNPPDHQRSRRARGHGGALESQDRGPRARHPATVSVQLKRNGRSVA